MVVIVITTSSALELIVLLSLILYTHNLSKSWVVNKQELSLINIGILPYLAKMSPKKTKKPFRNNPGTVSLCAG